MKLRAAILFALLLHSAPALAQSKVNLQTQVKGVLPTANGGTGNTAGVPVAANPSATASDTAINGSALTWMRSDAAPAVQKGSSSAFGVVKVDGTTITATGGVISAVGASGSPGGSSGQIQYNNAGSFGGFTLGGDCTFSVPNFTCTKTGGTNFVASATTDTTNAANISSGVLGSSRGGAGAVTGLLKANGSGVVSAASSGTDYAPATSGSSILYGDGSGGFSSVTVGGGLSFTTGTLSATGGTGTVTSIATSGLVAGGTITTTGTISLSNIAAGNLVGNSTGSSAAPASTTLSALIDQAIGSTQGQVLYRGSSAWSALSTGTAGQVLRTNGAGNNPSWATVGTGTTGGSSLAWPIQGTGTASGTSAAAHGTYFTVLTDVSVSGLWALTTTVSGATYRVSIYQVNTSGVISSVVADSADIASPGAVTGTNVGAKFSSPVTLAAGNNYVVSFRRTDGGDTAVVGVFGLSTATLPTYAGLPIQFTSTTMTKFATLAKATPAVSDTFTLGGTGYYSVAVLFSTL